MKRITFVHVLSFILVVSVYMYSRQSDALKFVRERVEHSEYMRALVGENMDVNIPVFGGFSERFIGSNRIVKMNIAVSGSKKSVILYVVLSKNMNIWSVDSLSIDGINVDAKLIFS